MSRILWGISGLNRLIGLRRGYMVTVAGNPGVGKSTFAAQFIHEGARIGEGGVYVSFAEGKDTFIENMHGLGMDFKSLEEKGRFKYLDMVTMREGGLSTMLESILDVVARLGAERLVIDSFTAISQILKDRLDARILLHTVFSKITRRMGVTTLLIVETPIGSERIGMGLEEFVSDALIILRRRVENCRIIREMEIVKMRGIPLMRSTYLFTIRKGGLHVLPPFELKRTAKRGKFEVIRDTSTHFSTGSKDLDRILGGGFKRGSTVFIEMDENTPNIVTALIFSRIVGNWLLLGKGCFLIPLPETPPIILKKMILSRTGVEEDMIQKQLVIGLKEEDAIKYDDPIIKTYSGVDIKVDMRRWIEQISDLQDRTKGPVFIFVPIDSLFPIYGDALKEALNALVTHTLEEGNLLALFSRTTYRIHGHLASLSNIHLKIKSLYGNILLSGEIPWTGYYSITGEARRGCLYYKLTPIE